MIASSSRTAAARWLTLADKRCPGAVDFSQLVDATNGHVDVPLEARRIGLPVRELIAQRDQLERAGLIERCDRGWIRRTFPPHRQDRAA